MARKDPFFFLLRQEKIDEEEEEEQRPHTHTAKETEDHYCMALGSDDNENGGH